MENNAAFWNQRAHHDGTTVTQTASLLYRRLAVGRRQTFACGCGLAIRDTAGCQPALRVLPPRQPPRVAQTASLLYRRLVVGRRLTFACGCGLAIRDTAGCQPALRGWPWLPPHPVTLSGNRQGCWIRSAWQIMNARSSIAAVCVTVVPSGCALRFQNAAFFSIFLTRPKSNCAAPAPLPASRPHEEQQRLLAQRPLVPFTTINVPVAPFFGCRCRRRGFAM